MDDKLSGLPDIPGLEQVECKLEGDAQCLFGCGGIAVAAIICIVTGHAILLLAVIPVAIGLMGLLIYLTTATLRTEPDGISFSAPLRHTYIAWPNIVSARADRNELTIKSAVATVCLPLPIYSNGERMEASIWQHLRRHGMVGGFEPSDDTLSIWAEIPEDIPEEMDYFDNFPPELGVPATYQLTRDYISETFVATEETQEKDERSDNLRVIRWENVTDVGYYWAEPGYDFCSVKVITEDGECMFIYDRDSCSTGDYTDLENAHFLLAVIRRGRQIASGPAIPIPEGLRKLCGVKLPTE